MVGPLADIDPERAAAAFATLSDPVRIEIIRALREQRGASFSELQEATSVTDSGRFNYHLDQLTDHFVRRTDDGYELRPAGLRVLNIATSGGFTVSPSVEPVGLSPDCPECDAGLVAEYTDGWFRIHCPECGIVPHFSMFPPRGIPPRDTDEFLRTYSAWIRRQFSLAAGGLCPFCGGRTDCSLDFDPDWYLDVAAHTNCHNCTSHVGTPVGLRLLDRPPVAGFLDERGVRVDRTPFWQFDWCLATEGVSIETRDPPRIVQTIRQDGDELRLTVDDDLTIVGEERVLRS